MLFRTRELLLTQKTQLANALRAHLAEHGVLVAGGRQSINLFIRVLDDMTNPLPHVVRKVGATYLDRIAQTAGEIEDLERQIDEQAKEHEMAQRLRTIPGAGRSRLWPSKLSLRPWRVLRAAGISQPGLGLFLGSTPVEASSAWGELRKWDSATFAGC